MPKTILLVGTLDTKGEEYAYVRGLIQQRGHQVLLMDAGVFSGPMALFTPEIDASQVAKAGGSDLTSPAVKYCRLVSFLKPVVKKTLPLKCSGEFHA